jgi:hypothetical protein
LDKVIIIGGGFSAFVAKTICGENSSIITPQDKNFFSHTFFKRRSNIECNKLAAKKIKSYGTLLFKKDASLKLHDRPSLGGNSNVWGGIINIEKIPQWFIKKMVAQGVLIGHLNYSQAGSIANNPHIKQLANSKKMIFDAQTFLSPDEDGYLDIFFIKGRKIGLQILYKGQKGLLHKKIVYTKRLALCTGVVQTIDLLYKSNFIKDGDIISLSEFRHQLKYHITFDPHQFEAKETSSIIRYDFLGATSHFLGLQKIFFLSHLFRWVPFYVDQYFMREKSLVRLKIEDGYVKNMSEGKIKLHGFGDSIHYCNMKINGKKIDNFLKNINVNIYGVGMAFLDQASPGPISNDIVLNGIKKIHS